MNTQEKLDRPAVAPHGGWPGACGVAARPGEAAHHGLTLIERRRGWRLIDGAELWRYRELLFFLTWRDIKVRYKHTVLGAAWAIVQPLGVMLVLCSFLRRVAVAPGEQALYPLAAFAGLLPWMFFANGTSAASQSVATSQNLITKIYFPRLLIPLAAIGNYVVDLGVAFGPLLGMLIYYGVVPGVSLLWLPVIVVSLLAATAGVGCLLAALTVTYRDFRHLLPYLLQLWLFATPSAYLHSMELSTTARCLLHLNPAYGLVLNFRSAILGETIELWSLGATAAVSGGLLLLGCHYFRRAERRFADVL